MATKQRTPATREHSGPWYDQPPAGYARGLRFSAARCDETAKRMEADPARYASFEVTHFQRAARRCRAMATLCERSKADRAGDVNFQGLDRPGITPEDEETVVAAIEASAANGSP